LNKKPHRKYDLFTGKNHGVQAKVSRKLPKAFARLKRRVTRDTDTRRRVFLETGIILLRALYSKYIFKRVTLTTAGRVRKRIPSQQLVINARVTQSRGSARDLMQRRFSL